MKNIYKFNHFLIALVLIAFVIGCGGNPYEEGLSAFQKGDYNLAIKYLSEARQETPENQSIDEKLATSYMLRGKELFEKRKNLSAYTGNFSKGEEFIPASPSTEFQIEYSNLIFDLANAYQNTKPENDVQKEDFLNKTISSLETSLVYNPDNNESEDLLNQIKSENFTAILEKGKRLFSQAKKEDNKDLYFTAEYYFIKANNFDPENQEALSYLSKTRQQTLDVLDLDQDFAIAIVDQTFSKGSYIFEIGIQNNSPNPVKISHSNFILMDKNGTSYPLDKTTMSKFKNALTEKSLTDRKTISGIIAFKMNKKTKIDYIGYSLGENKVVKKYFP
jgi:hypothetical protein